LAKDHPVDGKGKLPSDCAKARNEAGSDWIGDLHEHDRQGAGRLQ
jgi:hypothetical protein